MLAGGPFDESVLVVSEGFDALARPLVGVKRYEQKFDVWDANGLPVGHVEPTHRDTLLAKLFRLLLALVFSGSTRRDVLDFRVVDKLGGTVLTLLQQLEVLDRSDARLHALAVGFTCGLVDRVWLRVPKAPLPGN